jgi:phosphoadenosine phosphosulfate reductase
VTAAYELTTEEHLEATAVAAGSHFEGAKPQEILGWAIESFGEHFVIATSMSDGLLAHMAESVAPGVDMVFLDTGYHFAETIGTRDAIAATYDVRVHTLLPLMTVEEQDAGFGKDLFGSDPDTCCALRKVEPLERGLAPYLAWCSGIRRDESATRRHIRVVEWDAKRSKVKLNPLAAWTQADVDRYIEDNNILVNPLQYDGYPSIGCAPCTRRVAEGEDPRSGRWAGTGKVECGIHV